MDHYQLGETRVIEPNIFSDVRLDDNAVHMMVQAQSRMHSLLGFALNKMKMEDVKQIVWYAEGPSSRKATNCAEVMKKKQKMLYMLTRKGFKRTEEFWDPIYPETGLDRLKVNRDTDVVSILLSKQPLTGFETEPGYVGVQDLPAKPAADKHSQEKATSRSKQSKEFTNKKQSKHRPRSNRSSNNQSSPRNTHPKSQANSGADVACADF